jgi:polyisoprenoid-binding protein YceI
MQKHFTLLVLIVAALLTACSDPAANKPKATVAGAQPESSAAKPAVAETLVISPQNSKVDFTASKVTRSHEGSFKQFAGKIELAGNDIPNTRVTIDIDTGSVETDTPDLTNHLKTPDFFDVAKFPKATFTSTKIERDSSGNANSYVVTGNLNLHGQSKSVTFPAAIEVTADNATLNAEFAINRKDFGIVFAGKADDLIRDAVVLKLNVKAPRQKH